MKRRKKKSLGRKKFFKRRFVTTETAFCENKIINEKNKKQ